MPKGKYAARAALREDEQAKATIKRLEADIDEQDEIIQELQRANQQIPHLERAAAYAHEQAEQVTNPEIERLQVRLDKALAEVEEVDRNRPHRERIFKVAQQLLMKHEGMTAWEASEAVTTGEHDTIMVENQAQKKLPPKIIKAIQRARGLRNA